MFYNHQIYCYKKSRPKQFILHSHYCIFLKGSPLDFDKKVLIPQLNSQR